MWVKQTNRREEPFISTTNLISQCLPSINITTSDLVWSLILHKQVIMELSQDDLDYIDSMFDSMDINKDGSISLRELTKGKHESRIKTEKH